MFGIGPMELIVIAIFAIVFIGPQNLPHTLAKFAKFFVKAKRYSSDIKVGFDDMVRKAENEMHLAEVESNLSELKKVGGIGADSLKPLSTQQLAGEDAAKGASAGPDGALSSSEEALSASAESELFAGLPTHVDGKPVNPSFDDMDDDHADDDKKPSEQGDQEQKALLERLAKEEQDHEEMIKSLQDKLQDPHKKS